MAENTQFYDIVKQCKGGLTLQLSAFDSTVNDRTVYIPHNVEKVRVPRVYALGIFTNGTLERMYKEGKFTIEPAKQFKAEVAEIFFPVEKEPVIVKNDEIKTLLIKGNRNKIRELINENDTMRHNIIVIARENIGDLSTSMVKDLEQMLQVELAIENE